MPMPAFFSRPNMVMLPLAGVTFLTRVLDKVNAMEFAPQNKTNSSISSSTGGSQASGGGGADLVTIGVVAGLLGVIFCAAVVSMRRLYPDVCANYSANNHDREIHMRPVR